MALKKQNTTSRIWSLLQWIEPVRRVTDAKTERHEELTAKRSYIICLASFCKSNYNVQGKCREEKSAIHRGHIEKVISAVHLSRCFEKVLKHVYPTCIWKPFTSVCGFPLCLATAQKKLSETSTWRWHLWVKGLKLKKPLTHVNKPLLFPHDRPGSVADLWFDAVPHGRTNAAELKGKLQKINFTCRFSYCHLFEIHLSKGD